MKRTRVLFLCALMFGGGLVFSAVRQVRVTAERAAVYAEPSRKSTRIDIVQKGALLNLFQQQKVKEIWYYVSYNSRRYGSRMSGFVLEAAVEPVEEGAPPVEKPVSPAPEIRVDEKRPEPSTVPVKPPAVVVQAAPEKTQPSPAQPSPKPAAAQVSSAPEKTEISPAPAPEVKKEEPKVVEYSVVTRITPAPRARRLSLPRRSLALLDNPWAILRPAVQEPQGLAAKPRSPETIAGPKAEMVKEKPAAREPEKPRPAADSASPAPQVRPPRRAQAPSAARGPARLGVGLGFGPSFGGAGGSIQFYLSRSLALHAGLGIYPTTIVFSETDWVNNEMFWSAGLRFYPSPASEKLTPYIDAQYGGLRVEAAQVITGIYEYSYIYRREQKVLWGPSLLAGLEFRFGRLTLSGGLGGSYSLTDWEFLKSRLSFAFEAGLGVRL